MYYSTHKRSYAGTVRGLQPFPAASYPTPLTLIRALPHSPLACFPLPTQSPAVELGPRLPEEGKDAQLDALGGGYVPSPGLLGPVDDWERFTATVSCSACTASYRPQSPHIYV